MTRVLVTGGSGFIGRPLVERLVASGQDVHVASRGGAGVAGATGHAVDLLDGDASGRLVRDVGATHLIHLAWFMTPGRFWAEVDENRRWLLASERLFEAFVAADGLRVVGVGSAAEQQPSPYGDAKRALWSSLAALAKRTGASAAWARVFQTYGPGEDPARLVPMLVRELGDGREVDTSAGTHRRDFIHVDDVADALAAITLSAATGIVDVCTGVATPVVDVVRGVARRLGAEEHLRIGTRPLPAHEPDELVGDPAALCRIGWAPRWTVDTGLDETVRWWRAR